MGKKGSSLEEDKQQLQVEIDATKRQLEELKERHSKVSEFIATCEVFIVTRGCYVAHEIDC